MGGTSSSLEKRLENGLLEVRFAVFEAGFNLGDDIGRKDGLLLEAV